MGESGDQPGLSGLLRGRLKVSASEAHVYSDTYYSQKAKSAETEDQVDKRKANYKDVVNRYYDIATDFYEYGWGQAFHFADIAKDEPFGQALTRHEHRLAVKLQACKGMKLLDVGCGVGGPGREIALVSDSQVVGINCNDYQIKRANYHSQRLGLDHLCSYVKGDFMSMPFEDNTFDGAFAVEATCHAPDKVAIYKEIARVIKPGSCFACYDWIVRDKYDSSNPKHKKVIHDVLEGDGLPDLVTKEEVRDAAIKAGLEILELEDYVDRSSVPWYDPLVGSTFSMTGFRRSWLGRWVTHSFLVALETCHLAPKGVVETHRILCKGADGLVEAGKLDIFSPMLFFLARKPDK